VHAATGTVIAAKAAITATRRNTRWQHTPTLDLDARAREPVGVLRGGEGIRPRH